MVQIINQANTMGATVTSRHNPSTSLTRGENLSTAISQNQAKSRVERVERDVIFTTPITIGSVFTAKIAYLNLERLASLVNSEESMNALSAIREGDVISLQIVSSEDVQSLGRSVVTGKVLDTDHSGSTLIKTPFGLISSTIDLHRSSGTEILLNIDQDYVTPDASSIKPLVAQTSELLSKIFQNTPSLQSIVTLLRSGNEIDGYRKLANALLKRSNPNLTNKILRQSRSVGAKDVERWVEDEIHAPMLAAEEHNIVKQLAVIVRDIQARRQDESDDGDVRKDEKWYTIMLPIFDGKDIKQCELFVRGVNIPEHFIRFVVDIDVSQNKLQLDGLVHLTQHGSKLNHVDHLELTLRMQFRLEPAILKAISTIFLAHQRITGMKGMIKFEELAISPAVRVTASSRKEALNQSTLLQQDA